MALALLFDYLLPALAYIGALALALVVMVVAFWPRLENPLISWLTRQRDRRARRRRDAARRRAGRFFDWKR